MRIWPILFIQSDENGVHCIHLSRSLHLYLNYLVHVTAGEPEPEHPDPSQNKRFPKKKMLTRKCHTKGICGQVLHVG